MATEDRTLSEGVWRRGWRDFKKAHGTIWFWLAEAVLGAVVIWGATPVIWENPSPAHYLIVTICYLVAIAIVVWVGATTSAPIRQRNDAREEIARLNEKISAKDVDDRGLRISKNNNLVYNETKKIEGLIKSKLRVGLTNTSSRRVVQNARIVLSNLRVKPDDPPINVVRTLNDMDPSASIGDINPGETRYFDLAWSEINERSNPKQIWFGPFRGAGSEKFRGTKAIVKLSTSADGVGAADMSFTVRLGGDGVFSIEGPGSDG